MEEYIRANESKVMFADREESLRDRRLFVHNLGILMSQTRESIIGAELDDHEIVHVKYRGGHEIQVNVNMDSYFAILKEVVSSVNL